jgi:putative transposase
MGAGPGRRRIVGTPRRGYVDLAVDALRDPNLARVPRPLETLTWFGSREIPAELRTAVLSSVTGRTTRKTGRATGRLPISPRIPRYRAGTPFAHCRRAMSHPRRILPGETYLVTRRCYQRTFRLRPCAETNRIFMYCLAFAAERTGVVVHAACVMSNHHHLVVTDVHGVLPNFLRELHRLTAKAMNASQGQWENLWAAEPCSVVRLVTDEDVDDKIAYVIANPVAAGLVKQPDQWPGFLAWGERSLRAVRPASYFDSEGTCPEELVLHIQQPGSRSTTSVPLCEWRERVNKSVLAKVVVAQRKILEAGREFLGRAAVLASSFIRRAQSCEARFGAIPTFTARAQGVRAGLRRTERYFRARYRRALQLWRGGAREVLFPPGTWAMAVVHGAAVGETNDPN